MNNKDMEKRIFDMSFEVREDDESKLPTLRGYAAKFDSEVNFGPFSEVIRRGAFSRAISEKHDVRALIDHNPSLIVARSTAGTLRISEDDTGLAVEINPADTTIGRDLVTNIRAGNITQMSFAFVPKKIQWEEREDENQLREIHDLDLYDVAPVTYPAYEDTEIALRSKQIWGERSKELEEEKANLLSLRKKKLELEEAL